MGGDGDSDNDDTVLSKPKKEAVQDVEVAWPPGAVVQVPHVRGLDNLGNTCFFNATLQCLFGLDAFAARFGADGAFRAPVTTSLRALLRAYAAAAPGAALRPAPLHSALCARVPRFKGYGQQDAQELLMALFDGLGEEEGAAAKAAAAPGAAPGVTSVDALFAGSTESTVTCGTCGTVSTTREPFLDIQLPIPAAAAAAAARRAPTSRMAAHLAAEAAAALRAERKERKVKGRSEEAGAERGGFMNGKQRKKAEKEARRAAKHERRGKGKRGAEMAPVDAAAAAGEAPSSPPPSPPPSPTGRASSGEEGAGTDDSIVVSGSDGGGEESEEEVSSAPREVAGSDAEETPVEAPSEPLADADAAPPTAPPAPPSVLSCLAAFSADEALTAETRYACAACAAAHAARSRRVRFAPGAALESVREIPMRRAQPTRSDSEGSSEGSECDAGDGAADVPELAERLGAIAVTDAEPVEPAAAEAEAPDAAADTAEGGGESPAPAPPRRAGAPKQVLRDAVKRLRLATTPACLCLHMKRFKQDARGRTSKIGGHVAFEERLDLTPFTCADPLKPAPLYRLVGVVEHSGSLFGGHYVAFARRGEGEWHHASDRHVRTAALSEVLASEAYLLFYAREE